MAIEIEIDWKKTLVSDKERKKLNRRELIPLKKKIKVWELIKWSAIYFLWERADNFPIYEWKIIEELWDDKFKVNVRRRTKNPDNIYEIVIKTGKELTIDRTK